MVNGYTVDPTALQRDATTFEAWGKRLEAEEKAVPVGLTADNFSYIPQAQDLYASWIASAKAVQQYIAQGVVVFDGFARTLLKTELTYADAEHLSAADVAKVSAELAAL
jgi:hypothetical protein